MDTESYAKVNFLEQLDEHIFNAVLMLELDESKANYVDQLHHYLSDMKWYIDDSSVDAYGESIALLKRCLRTFDEQLTLILVNKYTGRFDLSDESFKPTEIFFIFNPISVQTPLAHPMEHLKNKFIAMMTKLGIKVFKFYGTEKLEDIHYHIRAQYTSNNPKPSRAYVMMDNVSWNTRAFKDATYLTRIESANYTFSEVLTMDEQKQLHAINKVVVLSNGDTYNKEIQDFIDRQRVLRYYYVDGPFTLEEYKSRVSEMISTKGIVVCVISKDPILKNMYPSITVINPTDLNNWSFQ